jgi:hypothetical protein
MTTLEVEVVQLQLNDGTRHSERGIVTDEITIKITGADSTVASLKKEILQEFFPGKAKSLKYIKVYSCPEVAGTAQLWATRAPKDALEKKTYGFIDLEPKQPNGELRCCSRIHFCIQRLLRMLVWKFELNCTVTHFESFIVVATPLAKRPLADAKSSSPVKRPKGGNLNLSTDHATDNLLGWLHSRMIDEVKLVSHPHLLDPSDELKYALQDRSEALETCKNLLITMFTASEGKVNSRAKYPIPVCSAMSGIGKSRLLDEFVDLMNETTSFSKIPLSRLALVLSYGNGHSALSEEGSMGSVAGFSWRLLYAVFLERNSEVGWEQFWTDIPQNAAELTLSLALKVIATANAKDKLVLFVGIDEYQLVPKNNVDNPKDPLVPLLETLLSTMMKPPAGVVLLPMFAGTDWDKMSLAASASSAAISANVTTKRLCMPLLSPEAMRRAVHGRDDRAGELLTQQLFCQHLFFLGGVPRPCTQYAEECLLWHVANSERDLGATTRKYEAIFTSKFNEFFSEVYMQAPRENDGKEGFTLRELIWLAAYSVRGGTVKADDKPFAKLSDSTRSHLSFGRLRDGSVCILGEDGRLGLPYCFFHHLSLVDEVNRSCLPLVEQCFLVVLRFLNQYVDHNVFSPGNSPWQQWELFGACFSALRINALLITSDAKAVRLSRIFQGAKHNLNIDHEVNLRPMTVGWTNHALKTLSPAKIQLKGEAGITDWVSTGVVVVNGDNGKGVDIFYTLELRNSSGNYILVTDQRKRVQGNLNVNATIKKARVSIGKSLKDAGIKYVVVALFSMFTCVHLELPLDSIAVTFEQHSYFHGALCQHPAASFCVSVNEDGVTALCGLFETGAQNGANAIIATRTEEGSIGSFEALQKCLEGMNTKLWGDAESLCIFSQ